MNRCEFKEIIILKNLKIKNNVLGLERDIYLSVVKFKEIIILKNFEIENGVSELE
jgi:hypothetical protein